MSVSVSKVISFPATTLQTQNDDCTISGGILSDNNHCWYAKGPHLEVRNLKTGRYVGTWTFGRVFRDPNAKIICLEELPNTTNRLGVLVVAVESLFSGGMICFFDIFGSRVIKAIQTNFKISSIHICDAGLNQLNFAGIFSCFDGILAVGSEGGDVFLIDICRSQMNNTSCQVNDEVCPSQIMILTPEDISDLNSCKLASRKTGDHVAIHLNIVLDSQTEHFTLKSPKNEDIIHVNKSEVAVSSLYYCPQLLSILIGYNFGAYQLWNLNELQLIYTSPICEDHLPITDFTIQEPVDDPKAYCYIWVSYSSQQLYQTGLPFVVMYTIYYETKTFVENYGCLYENFQYCSMRLQIDLSEAVNERKKVRGGCCLGFQSISRTIKHKQMCDDSLNDTLVLCVIGCSLWYKKGELQSFMLVFDLNQWYKEQMPSTPCWRDNYLLKVNINDSLKTVYCIKILENSLRQFIGVQKLEEHYLPTSLSFDFISLQNDAVFVKVKSVHEAFLEKLNVAGPLCLLRPIEFCEEIANLGLMPILFDCPSPIQCLKIEQQRELLLNVVLEQKLMSFLNRCAQEWSNGSFLSSGCSIEFLINWAFQRTVVLKQQSDQYCKQLFDYSEIKLDNNASRILNSCIRQLNSLNSFYSYVLKKFVQFLPSVEVVIEQFKCIQNNCLYFDVLQWFVNVGLLPECDPSKTASISYRVEELIDFYTEKRANLHYFGEEMDSLLFIDNLIAKKCGGMALQKQWQEDGGSGLYPPISFQSVLRTYLIDGSNAEEKHLLVTYFFLDLAKMLDCNQHEKLLTYLIKFPNVFNVSMSLTKLVQAFWQLDHGNYTCALEELLNPIIRNSDFEQWHHSVVLRSLLQQNQQKYALHYMQVKKPPILTENDIYTAISLFISNKMLDEAFYFQKHYQNDKLLTHLFNECNKHEAIRDLLYKNLNTNEERVFFNYLKDLQDPKANDLQVFYFLLRSKFIEAFDVYESFERNETKKYCRNSDQIVRIFKNLMPNMNRNLVNVVRKERVNLLPQKVERPKPLSVFVKSGNEQVCYKSTLFNTILTKINRNFNEKMDVTTDDVPFLRAPITNQSDIKQTPVVINCKIIDDDYSTPSKRLKLSPRQPVSSPSKSIDCSINKLMNTPIVKRQTPLIQNENSCTPQQSILKGSKIVDKLTPSSFSVKGRDSLRSLNVRFDETPSKSQLNESVKTDSSTEGSENVFYSPENVSDEVIHSPKGRQSYKRSYTDSVSTSSSPLIGICSPKARPLFPPRKSLNRQAVENAIRHNLSQTSTIITEKTTVSVVTDEVSSYTKEISEIKEEKSITNVCSDTEYSWGDLTYSAPSCSSPETPSFIKNFNKKKQIDENNEETNDYVLLKDIPIQMEVNREETVENLAQVPQVYEEISSGSDDIEGICNKEVEKQTDDIFSDLYNDLSNNDFNDDVIDTGLYSEQNVQQIHDDVIEITSSTEGESDKEESDDEDDEMDNNTSREESENDMNDGFVYEELTVNRDESEESMEALTFDDEEESNVSSNGEIKETNDDEAEELKRSVAVIVEEQEEIVEHFENETDEQKEQEQEEIEEQKGHDKPEFCEEEQTTVEQLVEKQNEENKTLAETAEVVEERKGDEKSEFDDEKQVIEQQSLEEKQPLKRTTRRTSQVSTTSDGQEQENQQEKPLRRSTRRTSQISFTEDENTPSTSKRTTRQGTSQTFSTENTPIKKRGRKSSQELLEATPQVTKPRKSRSASVDDVIQYKNILFDDDEFPETPEIRKSDESKKKTYKRTRSTSKSMDDYENKLFDEDVLIKTPVMLKRRTRSASVDDIKSYKTKASLRSSSEKNSSNDGVKTYSKKSKDRTLPAIIEENQEKPYSDSRRLTRLQASMLKENEAKTKPLKQEDNEKSSPSPKQENSRQTRASSVASDVSRKSKRSVENSSIRTRSKSKTSEGDEEPLVKKSKESITKMSRSNSVSSEGGESFRRSTRSRSRQPEDKPSTSKTSQKD